MILNPKKMELCYRKGTVVLGQAYVQLNWSIALRTQADVGAIPWLSKLAKAQKDQKEKSPQKAISQVLSLPKLNLSVKISWPSFDCRAHKLQALPATCRWPKYLETLASLAQEKKSMNPDGAITGDVKFKKVWKQIGII